jgi:hypothetical protein
LQRYETWLVTEREEHGLRMFGTKMPRKISGPKKDGETAQREDL